MGPQAAMTEILIFISSNFAFEIYSKHGNIRVQSEGERENHNERGFAHSTVDIWPFFLPNVIMPPFITIERLHLFCKIFAPSREEGWK